MPPLILWAFGAIGAAVVAKWLVRETRRINAGLEARERARSGEPTEAESRPTLQRDPVTGIYRPK